MKSEDRLTDRSKRVLELALREALELGHSWIAPEHLLLTIVREGESLGAQALDGVKVRKRVLELMRGTVVDTDRLIDRIAENARQWVNSGDTKDARRFVESIWDLIVR